MTRAPNISVREPKGWYWLGVAVAAVVAIVCAVGTVHAYQAGNHTGVVHGIVNTMLYIGIAAGAAYTARK